MTKRLEAVNVKSTPENRLSFREILFLSDGMKDCIGGVILYDETINQISSTGKTIPDLISSSGAIPGIKVDTGAKDLNGYPQKKELKEVLSDEMILDIGPKTIDKISKIIDNSKTILWNGPAGYFENPNFAYGSIQIAKKIIENNKTNKIFSVVGGGDTVSLINNLNAVNEFNFVSTAGGAFLEYLEGKNLPGITALN